MPHEVRVRDDVIELVEHRRDRAGPAVGGKAVAVPLAALDAVLPHFEGRLDVPPGQRIGRPADRMAACLTMLAGREVPRELNEITGLYSCDHVTQAAAWCTEAGVPHELTEHHWADRPPVRTRRHTLMRIRPPEETGLARTLWLELSANDGRAGAVRFHESYRPAGGDPVQHTVMVDHTALDRLVAAVESRLAGAAGGSGGDPEARLVAAFRALIDRGALGAGLPCRRNRDLVRAWCEEAGVPSRLVGRYRQIEVFKEYHLPDGDTLFLHVISRTGDARATIEFGQMYFPPRSSADGDREPVQTNVVAPLASLDALVDFFERRLGLPARPATEQRLVECLTHLVEGGELGAPLPDGLPAAANADRVAAWFAAAGVPYETHGERKYRLLKAHRSNTDCVFTLRLTLRTRDITPPDAATPVRHTAVTFWEYYDYLPRRGDAGREYGYSAEIPETPALGLVTSLERRLGLPAASGDDLDARLVACFAELVRRGELADGLPLEANRNRVADLLAAAGLPVRTDFSCWFDSE